MPTVGNTSRPAYVYDSETDTWIPIGVGPHTHNYVDKTLVDAKGDLLVGSAADTLSKLAVGSADQVLTVDSSTTTGLKWATPAAGGMTLISTTTLTGASVTLSSIPQTYNDLRLVIRNHKPASDSYIYGRFNGVSSGVYWSDTVSGYYNYNSVSLSTETTFTYTSDTDNTVDRNLYVWTLYDYANTATYKIGQSNWYKVGSNGTDNFIGIHNTLYAQTSAISSILLANSTGNFTSGTVYLYGVK